MWRRGRNRILPSFESSRVTRASCQISLVLDACFFWSSLPLRLIFAWSSCRDASVLTTTRSTYRTGRFECNTTSTDIAVPRRLVQQVVAIIPRSSQLARYPVQCNIYSAKSRSPPEPPTRN
ncbi:hypothetical protein BDW62DRAFT_191141 [Aspergillus aurantiobrunneus]